jgi:hypothetical protein
VVTVLGVTDLSQRPAHARMDRLGHGRQDIGRLVKP